MENETRYIQMVIKVTPKEKELIQGAAESSDCNVSQYIRSAIFKKIEGGEYYQSQQIKEIRDLTLKLKIAISKLNEGGVGGIL